MVIADVHVAVVDEQIDRHTEFGLRQWAIDQARFTSARIRGDVALLVHLAYDIVVRVGDVVRAVGRVVDHRGGAIELGL